MFLCCKKRCILFLAIFFLIIACKTTSDVSPIREQKQAQQIIGVDPADMALFEKAFEDMGAGNYYSTIPVFENLATKYKGQDLEWASLFNLAGAYKELVSCDKAKSIYEKLLQIKQLEIQIKSKTYLNLSYMYECLGKTDLAFLALRQGIKLNQNLAKEIKNIEYPFRFSLAYFRAGEFEKAMQWQERVHANLNILKTSFLVASEAEHKFAEIFYQIGRLYIKAQHINLGVYFRIFSWHQMYLCQSILMDVENWSTRSLYELNKLYNHFFIAFAKIKDKKQKKTWMGKINKHLQELKILSEEGRVEELHSFYKKMKKKLSSLRV